MSSVEVAGAGLGWVQPVMAVEIAWWALPVAVALLAANALFVAIEFAVVAARPQHLKEVGGTTGRLARRATHDLNRQLAGAQLGITMCSLGLGLVAEPAVAAIFEGLFGEIGFLADTSILGQSLSHVIGFAIALSIVVFLHMVVGEMAPKSWAISHPEDSALKLARTFRAFVTVFRPVIWFMNGIANFVVKLVGEPADEVGQKPDAVNCIRDVPPLPSRLQTQAGSWTAAEQLPRHDREASPTPSHPRGLAERAAHEATPRHHA